MSHFIDLLNVRKLPGRQTVPTANVILPSRWVVGIDADQLRRAPDLMSINAVKNWLPHCFQMDDLDLVTLAARLADQAGAEILAIRARGYTVSEKLDRSPVTDADLISQRTILNGLRTRTPDIPAIAEESATNRAEPIPSVFWLVDPLDGTREFAANLDEFVVNIGLIRDHEVVLGAVAAPARHEVYTGVVGRGAWKRTGGTDMPIQVRDVPRDGPVALVSRHDADDQRLPSMLARYEVAETVRMGSGLKFCRIAEGKADLYVRPGRTMEWDTAAPHAILQAAGGTVLTTEGKPLLYGKPNWENPSFVCAGAQSARSRDQDGGPAPAGD
ncbi:3'(2'),5'-bisphosphate nucleotidase CysQ [Borborobacter arsenicus]|nr:3'(2'),5'-bisphosphate nucleotidase CysQ [Pseudaminobacter arsenicus]